MCFNVKYFPEIMLLSQSQKYDESFSSRSSFENITLTPMGNFEACGNQLPSNFGGSKKVKRAQEIIPRPKTEERPRFTVFATYRVLHAQGVFFPIRSSVTRSPFKGDSHRSSKTSQNSLRGLAIQHESNIESPKSFERCFFIPWHDHDQQSSATQEQSRVAAPKRFLLN